MLRLVDCHDNLWDPYVSWFTDDPHYYSAYYRAFGNGKLAIFERDNECIVQPFMSQGVGWIGNAFNFGGAVGNYRLATDFFRDLRDYKQAFGLNERCTLNPFLAQPYDLGTEVSQKEVVYVDLEQETKLRPTTRHLVAKAAAAGVNTSRMDGAVRYFEELYSDAMERKNAADHWFYRPGFFEDLLNGLGPKRSALFVTSVHGKPQAGCVLIFGKDVCYYQWAATEDHRSAPGINQFQVSRVIEWARNQGIKKLHLGGGLQGRDGLFLFKSGFSNLTLPCVSYETYAREEAVA